MNKTRVLQVLYGAQAYDGVQRVVLRFYSYIDRERFRFDFAICSSKLKGALAQDEDLADSKIYELGAFKSDKKTPLAYLRLYRNLRRVVGEHRYDIVHVNTGSIPVQAVTMLALRHSKVRVRIAHSHGMGIAGGDSRIKRLMSRSVCKNATHLFSCSTAAGIHLFGEEGIKSDKYRLINNALDVEDYRCDEQTDRAVRDELGYGDEKVFGFVGRLIPNKNVVFLLDAFRLIRQERQDAKLWIVGDGELYDELQAKVSAYGLTDSVVLWGKNDEVPRLMQAMDAMLFPSKYEGLSLVVVEAQAAGMPVYCSDTISQEHRLTDKIKFLSIGEGPEVWAQQVLADYDSLSKSDTTEQITASGYNIRYVVKELEEIYSA